MRLKDFSLVIACVIYSTSLFAQYSFSGKVVDAYTGFPLSNTEIYNTENGKMQKTDADGAFQFNGLKAGYYTFIVFAFEHDFYEETIYLNNDIEKVIKLQPLSDQLSEVVINQYKEKLSALRHLKPVEGTSIYAGKKSEVILMNKITGNLAANNARQIYNRVVGLNIYDNGDAGLQLNIGGRGLDPNRTQNFNTRQDGYDISADVLGYPESYYTPSAEALEEIQVVRGAASLQYGTQFGGLVNFKFHKPNPYKKIELISRQTLGSYNLYTSFNSLSGTVGKFSYYTFYNYKTGNGFRPNSGYDSKNAYAFANYNLGKRTNVSIAYTYLDYLAQQPGGLTDFQFYKDPKFSNRKRNWFSVNWNLFAAKFNHEFSENTSYSFTLFGLKAFRKALGFRQNRVSQEDYPDEARELLIDNFQNWGIETKFLHNYKLFNKEATFLIGAKYYDADNNQEQGPGHSGSKADFSIATKEFPYYERQSKFRFPNRNLAIFGEHIFNITDEFSVTPGIRFENIRTQAEGAYKYIVSDRAGNAIFNKTFDDNRDFERSFVLLGVGLSYKPSNKAEFYANISQNYRSVTFSDIRVVNPVFIVDANIRDEEGYTSDIGFRGNLHKYLVVDVSVFGLRYSHRIGEVYNEEMRENANGIPVSTGRLVRYRGNIGDAFIYGFESFAEADFGNIFFSNPNNELSWTAFVNFAYTKSNYISSQENNVVGNQVEFIPLINLKTGTSFGYKNFMSSLQYTYLSKQYTDATNAPQDKNDKIRGIEGAIPGYGILDLSLSYKFNRFKLETGINNLLDNMYFSRRATGYPGPGILPAQPLTWYAGLQIKI